jgi:hypothetical protein
VRGKGIDGGSISLSNGAGYSFSFTRSGETWQLLVQMP